MPLPCISIGRRHLFLCVETVNNVSSIKTWKDKFLFAPKAQTN